MERKWLDNYEHQENYIINNQNNDIIPIAQDGRNLKRLLNENIKTDSNSIINYTKLKNINPGREIKKQTQKIENVQKKNNVSRKKALEIIQKEEFYKNISRNPQGIGEISIPEDQSIASKTWEVLTNPVTAASYWLNDQRIPDRFSKGERNNLDIATDLFNPFGIINSGKNAVKETINLPKNLYNGEYSEAGSNFLNAGLNTLSVIPALKELKGANAPISKLYNKIATGESTLPIAWKSPIKNMTQEKSFNLFNQIKQSHDFTDAEKVLLAEYQFDSVPFTGRYENRFSPEKRDALQKMIEKSKIEFPDDIVLSRRFNVQNSEVNGFKNSKHFEIGDRPSSFSSGIGAKDITDSPDRLIISGRNAKKIQDNFLKSIYEPLPEEVVDNIENYTDLKKAGFTGKPETYTTASGTENTIYPINDGFVRTFHNSTKEEKELIGSGFNLKKIGRVKNELGGHDYIMKPIEIPKKREGGVIKDNDGYWNPDNWGKVVEIDSNDITMKGVNQPLLGISDEGDVQYMEPNRDYKFKGKKVTEFPIAQKGKNIKYSDLPYNENDIKNFYDKMLTSDWYKQRLIDNGYGISNSSLSTPYASMSKLFTSNNDMNKEVNKIIESRRKIIKNIPITLNKDYSTSYTNITDWNQQDININPDEINELRVHPRSALVHEIGHAETDDAIENNKQISGIEEDIFKSNRKKYKTDFGKYVQTPKEAKGDINSIRYNLYKAGKFDVKTGKYKTKDGKFDKTMITPIKDDTLLKRMLDAYGEEGLTELMNKIAQNNNQDFIPIARNGINNLDENSLQQLDQLTNFTNYNKLSNGGWLDKF